MHSLGTGVRDRWIDRSLGHRIAVLVMALLAVTGTIMVGLSYRQLLQSSRIAMEQRLDQLAGQLARSLSSTPTRARTALAGFAASPALAIAFQGQPPDRSLVEAALPRSSSGAARTYYAAYDSTGRPLGSSGPAGGGDWQGPREPVVALPAQRDGSGASAFRALPDSTMYYDIWTEVHSGPSRLGWVVARVMLTGSPSARDDFARLAGASAAVMVGSVSDGAWTDLAGMIPPPPPGVVRVGVPTRFTTAGGQSVFGSAALVEGTPWAVIVVVPAGVVSGPAKAFLRWAGIASVIVTLIGSVAAFTIGRHLVGPLREITETTRRISAGDRSGRAADPGPGELGTLARSFNQMVDRIAESDSRLRAFLSQTSQGVWRVDLTPPVPTSGSTEEQVALWFKRAPLADCNPALARMLGVEASDDLVQLPLASILPPDEADTQRMLLSFVAGGYRVSEVESRLESPGQIPRVFVNDLVGILQGGTLRGMWGTRRDATLERTLDERIAQNQRLEAIGRLAGGIAHDFNNLLTVIMAGAEALKERDGGSAGEAAEILQAANRGAQLTKQLLSFSRGQIRRSSTLDLNAVLASFEGMLRRVIGEDITLTMRLTIGAAPIQADASQIERALMNLVVNARDAMPEGGHLEIRTSLMTLDEEYVRSRPGLVPGPYYVLAVTDTGTGMSDEVVRHAFEPFFTTKHSSGGTGLGLASVYGIVRQSNGEVAIYSEPGRGTAVRIYLPAYGQIAPVVRPPAQPPLPGPAIDRTVLMVEDDPALRRVIGRTLDRLRLRVLEAEDGVDGLRLLEQVAGQVDLVLTDMVMPKMNGVILIQELRKRWPELPVILTSGYVGEEHVGLDRLPADVVFLEKPFSVGELHKAVSELLNRLPDS